MNTDAAATRFCHFCGTADEKLEPVYVSCHGRDWTSWAHRGCFERAVCEAENEREPRALGYPNLISMQQEMEGGGSRSPR